MAGRIPQNFIDDLINRVDIVEVIDARVQLKKAGREYTACCPFHAEKTPSFTVSPNKQFYHCFGCGAHGTAIGFLMEYEHMEFVEAVEELARTAGLDVPREAGFHAPEQSQGPDLYPILEQAESWYRRQLREHDAAERAVEYLKRRGLSGEIAKRFGIGYAPPGWDNLLKALGTEREQREALAKTGMLIDKEGGGQYDRFRDRIMFPIRDRRGRVIGFGGRILDDGSPKYLNSPETPVFHKGRELYGLFEARKHERKLERLLVVEGYMDVVALAQFGIGYAVATLGTATTREHAERLFRTVPEVVFCFDGDRAGRAAGWRALENALPVLSEGRQARFLFLPDGEDPDSLIRKEGMEVFEERIANSVPFSEFFYGELVTKVDISSMDGRARLAELAKPLLRQLPEGIFRDMMLSRLSELAQMPPAATARYVGAAEAEAPPQRAPVRKRPDAGNRNPVREGIALLLQRPHLAAEVDVPEGLAGLDTPGVSLLAELLELLGNNPEISRGAVILERYRGNEHERALHKLAQMPVDVPESGQAAELQAILRLVVERERESRWTLLQDKLQTQGHLSADEMEEWKHLMQPPSPPTERGN